MSFQNKKIGLLGGSFDPIHMGHLNIASSAREEFSLDEVWFIPTGHSPNKKESRMTPAGTRARMTELALLPYSCFKLCGIELESDETSYTWKTLQKLTKNYPDNRFYFIMGADSLDYFDKWVHPERICACAVLLVAVRDALLLPEIEAKISRIKTLFPAEIYPITGGKTDVSSTAVRKAFWEHDTAFIAESVPPEVISYINENRLYITEDLWNGTRYAKN